MSAVGCGKERESAPCGFDPFAQCAIKSGCDSRGIDQVDSRGTDSAADSRGTDPAAESRGTDSAADSRGTGAAFTSLVSAIASLGTVRANSRGTDPAVESRESRGTSAIESLGADAAIASQGIDGAVDSRVESSKDARGSDAGSRYPGAALSASGAVAKLSSSGAMSGAAAGGDGAGGRGCG